MNTTTYIILGVVVLVILAFLIPSMLARKKRARIKERMLSILDIKQITESEFKRRLVADGLTLRDDVFHDLTMELEHEWRIRITHQMHGSGSSAEVVNSYQLPTTIRFRM